MRRRAALLATAALLTAGLTTTPAAAEAKSVASYCRNHAGLHASGFPKTIVCRPAVKRRLAAIALGVTLGIGSLAYISPAAEARASHGIGQELAWATNVCKARYGNTSRVWSYTKREDGGLALYWCRGSVKPIKYKAPRTRQAGSL